MSLSGRIRTRTACPSSSSRRTRFAPRCPLPPVTSTVIGPPSESGSVWPAGLARVASPSQGHHARSSGWPSIARAAWPCLGPHFRARERIARSRTATALSGRCRGLGCGGHVWARTSELVSESQGRGPPRLRRGGAERLGVWGPCLGPHFRARERIVKVEDRHGSAGAVPSGGGCGGHVWARRFRARERIARSRTATAPPGRCRAGGVWGPCLGPHFRARERIARSRTATAPPGRCRAVGGVGAMSGPPLQ